jgi:protein-arginine kinase
MIVRFQTFLVWVNEEDHLRIISMQNGGNVGQVLERLIKGVNAIQSKVPFSRDDRLGWLTFCPTNLVFSYLIPIKSQCPISIPQGDNGSCFGSHQAAEDQRQARLQDVLSFL